jgi:hypothetical protein
MDTPRLRSRLRLDRRARKAVGGWPAALRCGGRRFASTALRCSVSAGERRTRPRTGGTRLRRTPVLGARTTALDASPHGDAQTREALRSSAPQRRAAGQPPTALRGTIVRPYEERNTNCGGQTHDRTDGIACRAGPVQRARWGARWLTQRRGRLAGFAPLRRRGAEVFGGCRAAGAVERSCLSTVGRAADKRASSSLAPEHRAPQGSRRAAATAAVKRITPSACASAMLGRREKQGTPTTRASASLDRSVKRIHFSGPRRDRPGALPDGRGSAAAGRWR